MRLNLERARPPVADVDDPRVLPRPLHHQLAARGQPLQVHARRLVGAVLAPHHAEDAEFGQRRRPPAQQLLDFGVLLRRQAVLPDKLRSNGRVLGLGHGWKQYCRTVVGCWSLAKKSCRSRAPRPQERSPPFRSVFNHPSADQNSQRLSYRPPSGDPDKCTVCISTSSAPSVLQA